MICGIDEAGRGAVLGPLVISGVNFGNSKVSKLKKLGVKDSKLLSPNQRENLFEEIIKLADSYEIIKINAKTIDNRFEDNKNLNTLEIDAFKKILQKLKPVKAFVDSVLKNENKLKEELQTVTNAKLTVEHKADENYVVVGAASILAKVIRDREMKKIESIFNLILGSGYPSDPKTVKFLQNTLPEHIFVRRSWASFKNVKAKKEQTDLSKY